MKFVDTCRLAYKGLKHGWAVITVLGIALSTLCFAFAGTILSSITAEKEKPCELTVQASGGIKLTDQTILDIKKIPGVMAATGSIEVPVTLTTGKYSAAITLYGIDPSYLQKEFLLGGYFSENSVMPYIIVNNAAVKEFIDKDNPPPSDQTDYAPAIDWLNSNIALYFGGESKPIISKVCGILASEEEKPEPAGYISISAAKTLLSSQKMPGNYTSVAVRIQSIGNAKNVTKQIEKLSYTADDPSLELQAEWERKEMEMTNLILTGVIGLLCFSFLIAAVDRGSLLEQHGQLDMMRWIGVSMSELKEIFFWRMAIVDIAGVLSGVLLSYILPSFISEAHTSKSIFAMSVPPLVAIVVGLVSTGVFLLPGIYVHRTLKTMK